MTMTFLSQNNAFRINMFRSALLLFLLTFFIFQTESIKFFSKKTQQQPNNIPQVPPLKTQKKETKQTPTSKTAQSQIKEPAKPAQSQPKTSQVKPQVSTLAPAPLVTKKQQKPQSKPSDEFLETLFGQSTQKKPSQVSIASKPVTAMTVKAEEHTASISMPSLSETSAVSNTEPQKKGEEANSIIEGLFDGKKYSKPTNTDSSKDDKTQTNQQIKAKPISQPKQASDGTAIQSKVQKIGDDKKGPESDQKTQKSETKEKNTEKSEAMSESKTREKTDQKVNKKDTKKEEKENKQEQSSGDVYYPASKKQTSKEDADERAKQQQKSEEKKSPTESDSEQDSQVDEKPKSQASKADSDDKQQDESQSQEIIYPKKPQKKSKDSPSDSQNPEDAKQKYSLTLFMTFCLYSLIIVLVIITIKCTNTSSKVVRSVQIMLGAVWNMFLVKKGYRKAAQDEEISQKQEEITQRQEDITVGYNFEDNNKQIFWEKNSVEGI